MGSQREEETGEREMEAWKGVGGSGGQERGRRMGGERTQG